MCSSWTSAPQSRSSVSHRFSCPPSLPPPPRPFLCESLVDLNRVCLVVCHRSSSPVRLENCRSRPLSSGCMTSRPFASTPSFVPMARRRPSFGLPPITMLLMLPTRFVHFFSFWMSLLAFRLFLPCCNKRPSHSCHFFGFSDRHHLNNFTVYVMGVVVRCIPQCMDINKEPVT